MTTRIEPTTDSTAEVSSGELQRLLDAQRTAQAADPIPDAATRRDRIDRFVAAVLEHSTELAEALDADFGSRPATVSLEIDILGSLGTIAYARENLEAWMAPTEVQAGLSGVIPTFVQNRPKGVVGVIGPWNFPVALVFVPTVEALAAGNRVMIKFSDMTPRTGEVFARAVASRMSPEEVIVINGGLQTATAFSELRLDHLFFTGSPKVGRLVAVAAGRNLVPVTLELGGKNPAIVAPDADIAEAAARIAAARLFNNGQVCLSPDYAFVPESGRATFVDAFRNAVLTHFPTFIENPDVVSIVNDANYARITGLVEDAKSKGATEIVIVPPEEKDRVPDAGARRLPPTLLLNTTANAEINSEEIFGPVLVLHTYSDINEAIAYVAAGEHPLSAYWYGADTDDFQRFLLKTTSGGVSRNDFGLAYGNDAAPFGGVGMSGSGAYHGKAGFDTFSHQRPVAQSDLPMGLAGALVPPLTPERIETVAATAAAAAADTVARLSGTGGEG
ncbi:aldehyde dehydrogenase family protein [Mycobacteroides immunogenum]|uniref:Aldehyde dehydrogenase n=1 Tax=Mycobacteroides immunogenum TaxID=83262 RepID=A0A7V8RVH0_9MYCO|nr:aldehyde dehydrogenase family protein [Mycobacteroides immunogenum]AMT72636.1 aldehyde dehydrogenase [Mycobacteroides immunogenum]ANO05801.1 aldehyde dehydrogenase [Mycobacteroides immunogenum]KIU41043.1 aldehyde dehydrogenase [Mycobacteroides immunogenum]KPG05950.1 aldehyde dehydrogenase [Mycobacteroides immunogenum]KPG07597.1 aldehyde dehydrogenase [Mycobacteroides immunogenum]